jgi:hypothetical protein
VRSCLRLTSPPQKYLTISAGWQRLGLLFETLRLFCKPFFKAFLLKYAPPSFHDIALPS